MVSDRDQVPLEELRLALVLNGGVSLAVWMGGTVREIDDLVRGSTRVDGKATGRYGAVLDLARTWASVDVIAGTSAGGINGACLALSQVNRNADLGALRDLWAEQGRIDSLLRRPFVGQPTSLLRGDEYFLPELTRAMHGLVADFEPTGADIDLSITTTLLNGALSVTTDGLGQQLPQRHHGASFHFSTSTDLGRKDDFAREQIATTATAMALAARSTAGFPFAFEPSFVPVGEESARRSRRTAEEPPGVDRIDMADWASWAPKADPDQAPARDRSRFTVDGGVLANTPTRHALDAIDRRPARNPMRRQMLLIFPHAPSVDPDEERADPPDHSKDTPRVTDSVRGLLGALTSQGSLTFVEEIETHNRQAARWRGGRRQVLENTPLETMYELVDSLWRHYRWIRPRAAARVLADRVPRPKGWSYQRVVEAAGEGQQAWPLRSQGEQLPYVPLHPPTKQYADGDGWAWGTTVALGIADSAVEMLLTAQAVATQEETGPLGEALQLVSDARTEMVVQRDTFDHVWWHLPQVADVVPNADYWQLRLLCYRRAMFWQPRDDDDLLREIVASLRTADGSPIDADDFIAAIEQLPQGTTGERTAAAVTQVLEALGSVTDLVVGIAADPVRGPLTPLGPWAEMLDPDRLTGEPADEQDRLLVRLLTLDAATWLLADAESTGTSQEIRLAQLSLGIDHHFPQVSKTPDDKVAGSELGRFGGFLKRSWRINDWIWGRLDAAQMLCRLVLNPERLRRIHALTGRPAQELAEEMVADLLATSYDGGAPPEDPRFERLVARAEDELTRLFQADPVIVASGYLPCLAQLAAHPVQQRIIVEELPALVAATRADLNDGGNPRSNGARFLKQHDDLFDDIADSKAEAWHLHGHAALEAFDRAGIGREPLNEEASSDAFIRTAITAAATGITLADSDGLGVKVLKPVTKVVRGAALVPYWLVTGLTSGSSAARSLAMLGFTVGGVLLALSLLGVLGGLSSAGAAIGTGTTLGALAYAALRSGTFLHGVVLLGPVVPLIALAFPLGTEDAGEAMSDSPVVSVLTVLGVALGLFVLASLPNPLRSPAAAVSVSRGTLLRYAALLAPLVIVAALVAIVATREAGARWSVDYLLSKPTVAPSIAVTAVAVVAAVAAGWLRGRGMRLWSRKPGDDWELEESVSHPAGVSAGWVAVYGIVYLALAWGTWGWAQWRHADVDSAPGWLTATMVWCAALGLGLCLAGPFLVTWLARRRIADRIAEASPAGTDQEKLDLLERRGHLFNYLVDAPLAEKRQRRAGTLRLNARGKSALPPADAGG